MFISVYIYVCKITHERQNDSENSLFIMEFKTQLHEFTVHFDSKYLLKTTDILLKSEIQIIHLFTLNCT